MSHEFGSSYADLYDLFYQDKDYEAECKLLQRLFAEYGSGPVAQVLDLGCGSGNHSIPLTRAGYRVLGVDRSEAMLAHARRKAAGLGDCAFLTADIRAYDLHRTFDAALMMFAVLGYQLNNEDVLAALATAGRHLSPGGLLIFDCWYGPAVLHEGLSDRVKTVRMPTGSVTRTTRTHLDTLQHRCDVRFKVQTEASESFHESHSVRFFFPKELELYLELAGFDLLRLGSFPEIEKDPDQTCWNVLCVARAKL